MKMRNENSLMTDRSNCVVDWKGFVRGKNNNSNNNNNNNRHLVVAFSFEKHKIKYLSMFFFLLYENQSNNKKNSKQCKRKTSFLVSTWFHLSDSIINCKSCRFFFLLCSFEPKIISLKDFLQTNDISLT